jgi:hypothetical protein
MKLKQKSPVINEQLEAYNSIEEGSILYGFVVESLEEILMETKSYRQKAQNIFISTKTELLNMPMLRTGMI